MAIEDGKDCRNWLKHPEQHMAIKEKRRMLRFQVRVFTRALKEEKKTYDALLAKTENRKKSYNPMFDSLEKLNDAYIIGQVDDRTYMSQRSKIWQVYSDRGHIANIAWLESELAKYQGKLDSLDNKLDALSDKTQENYNQSVQKRKRRASYMRGYRKEQKKQALQERWKKYGLI